MSILAFMDSQWLAFQFKQNPSKKKADLAQALNLSATAISKILAGTREIKAREYDGMRSFFDMPVDGEKRLASKHYKIKPFSKGAADRVEQASWEMPAELVQSRTNANAEDLRIFKVEENAMIPDFNPGEYVVIDTSIKKVSPPGVFLVSDGHGELLRQCSYINTRLMKCIAK